LFLSWWRNQTPSFSFLLYNYLLVLKILPVALFKDPKAAILTLKMLTGSRLWLCIIILEAACDKLILVHFPCSQWEVGARKRSTNHRNSNMGTVDVVFVIPIFSRVDTLVYVDSTWGCCVLRTIKGCGIRITLRRIRIEIQLLPWMRSRIRIRLFTIMQIRIYILLLLKVTLICDHWYSPGLHFEPPRDYASSVSIHGPPQQQFEHLKLLNFDSNADPNSDQDFHCNADADPVSLNNADPDPQPCSDRSIATLSHIDRYPNPTCSPTSSFLQHTHSEPDTDI
jgi:hypothetical protein